MTQYTFETWLSGNDLNFNSKKLYSEEDSAKILHSQRNFFNERVVERFVQMQMDIENRLEHSIDGIALISTEINNIELLIASDWLPYKITAANEVIQIAGRDIKANILTGIRAEYKNAINGTLDYAVIKPSAQHVIIGAEATKEYCMIEAVAYKNLFDYLFDRRNNYHKNKGQNTSHEYLSDAEQEERRDKIDEVLDRLSTMEFKLTAGQEIIYNEFEELKSLPALKKKTWNEIIKGKIVKLLLSKAVDLDTLKWIHQKLVGSDFKMLD